MKLCCEASRDEFMLPHLSVSNLVGFRFLSRHRFKFRLQFRFVCGPGGRVSLSFRLGFKLRFSAQLHTQIQLQVQLSIQALIQNVIFRIQLLT